MTHLPSGKKVRLYPALSVVCGVAVAQLPCAVVRRVISRDNSRDFAVSVVCAYGLFTYTTICCLGRLNLGTFEHGCTCLRCKGIVQHFVIEAVQPIPRECGAVAHDAPISVHRDIAISYARGTLWYGPKDCIGLSLMVAENFLGRG